MSESDRVLTLSETARLLRLTESQVPLTVRQHAVMQLMANGYGLEEIGYRLGISRWTVKEHVRAAIFRLDARNREDAVRLYTLAHPELVA